MVGAVSVVVSSLVESKSSPCLCLDALPSCNLSSGDLNLQRHSINKKHVPRLTSSFLDYSSIKALYGPKNFKKQRKNRSLVIVDELAGHYEDNFDDVKRQLLDYFTYKAVRTVLNQLYEMNPTQYRWLYDYVATNELGYGKRFIRNLQKEKHELAERVMVTRLHLYGKWIKRCDHTEMYERISDQNLELMRERLIETIVWPTDDANPDAV
ncbi:hypothetical protein RD792_003195 [Penstemon davidsonii]|uniref:Chaperonin-like RbcX protein n=1 Tax=Penstemon davidsonii TaxID=160366 RepID=A0ABR0DT34_9LAMI|nr:hypothetical protein RD792_003195 [Penstemon davidsonii]